MYNPSKSHNKRMPENNLRHPHFYYVYFIFYKNLYRLHGLIFPRSGILQFQVCNCYFSSLTKQLQLSLKPQQLPSTCF